MIAIIIATGILAFLALTTRFLKHAGHAPRIVHNR